MTRQGVDIWCVAVRGTDSRSCSEDFLRTNRAWGVDRGRRDGHADALLPFVVMPGHLNICLTSAVLHLDNIYRATLNLEPLL